LAALSKVMDRGSGDRSVRALGYLQGVETNESGTTVFVELPSPFHPHREALLENMRTRLSEVVGGGRGELKVSYSSSAPLPSAPEAGLSAPEVGPGLEGVGSIVAVYSCKGGVGKSTVATNLAFACAKRGLRVGLLDCDVYGPSLPTLVNPEDITVRRSKIGKMVMPIVHEGVKILSLGYVSPKSGVPGSGSATGSPVSPAVIRGPMASRVVTQLLKGTEWGELDVLLLDLPPGTGDVQLTICQEIVVRGAVAVTTPGELSKVDVLKGIEMFKTLNIPTLCAVENMAYFRNPATDEKHLLLGRSIQHEEMSLASESDLVRVPLSESVSSANDKGVPVSLSGSPVEEAQAYDRLADVLSARLFALDTSEAAKPKANPATEPLSTTTAGPRNFSLAFDANRAAFVVRKFLEDGASEKLIDPIVLRASNPKTGELMDAKRMALEGEALLNVRSVEAKGGYGYAVTWGNGGTIIYSLAAIEEVLKRS